MALGLIFFSNYLNALISYFSSDRLLLLSICHVILEKPMLQACRNMLKNYC